MRWIRHTLTYGLFPLWFCGSLAVATLGLEAEISPPALLFAIAFSTAAVLAVIEQVHPAHARWQRSHDDIPTDAMHVVVSQFIIPAAIDAGLAAAVLAFALSAGDLIGQELWPHQWPLAAQVALALASSQFLEYWFHRLAHTTPILWRLHATHHSCERLYFLNAGRFHPLDTAISATLSLGTLLFLGAGREVMVLLTAWITVHGLFQHCNVHLRLGPLNWIFSMAELHRWHHSLILEEANSNYGNNILLWDIVFGTVYWPRDRDASAEIGIGSMPTFPQRYWPQILSPFRWREIEAASTDEPRTERAT